MSDWLWIGLALAAGLFAQSVLQRVRDKLQATPTTPAPAQPSTPTLPLDELLAQLQRHRERLKHEAEALHDFLKETP